MRSAQNMIFNPLLLIKCLNMWVLRLAVILMGHKEDMPTSAQMPLSWNFFKKEQQMQYDLC